MSFNDQIDLWTKILKENLDESAVGAEYTTLDSALANSDAEQGAPVLCRLMEQETPEIATSVFDDQYTFVLPALNLDTIDADMHSIFTDEGIELINDIIAAGDVVEDDEIDYAVDTTDLLSRETTKEIDDFSKLYVEKEIPVKFDFSCHCIKIDPDKLGAELRVTVQDLCENPKKYIIDYDKLAEKFEQFIADDFNTAKENAKVSSSENYDQDGNERFYSDDIEESKQPEEQIDEGKGLSYFPVPGVDGWFFGPGSQGKLRADKVENCGIYKGKKVQPLRIMIWNPRLHKSIAWAEYCFAFNNNDQKAIEQIKALGLPEGLDLGIGKDFDGDFVDGPPSVLSESENNNNKKELKIMSKEEWLNNIKKESYKEEVSEDKAIEEDAASKYSDEEKVTLAEDNEEIIEEDPPNA